VIRSGKTKTKQGIERKRFLCTPNDDEPPHRFTPALSRLVVNHGEDCLECATLRAINKGDTNAARGHKFTTNIVAQALSKLANCESYGATSVWAKQEMDAYHRHGSFDEFTSPKQVNARKNSWRLAADWVESFSPILFDPWSTFARDEVVLALNSPTKDRPIVSLLLYDIPIFAHSGRTEKKRHRFSVIAACESFIDRDRGSRLTRVRLLRAFPAQSSDAYKLVLAELDYVPDVLMADGSTAIATATRWLARMNPGKSFVTSPSAYHLRIQLFRQLASSSKNYGFESGNLVARLENWSFIESSLSWQTWWSDYLKLMDQQSVPKSAIPGKWVKETKPIVDNWMHLLDDHSVMPRSTEELETVLFKVVEPSLSGRALGFGNLQRTNRLLDLLTLKANGQFEDLQMVAAALNKDAREHDGYVPPVRTITDNRMNRSLLDETMPRRLAKQAGFS
jgi:hypothetical protein